MTTSTACHRTPTTRALSFAIVAIVHLAGAPLFSQQPAEDRQLKVFALKNMQALEGSQMLRSLMAGGKGDKMQFAVDARTNTLIVSASAEDLRVVEALLVQLDQPQDNEAAAAEFHVIQLHHAPVAKVEKALSNALGPAGGKVSLDVENNRILLHANQRDIGKALQIVKSLDTPPVLAEQKRVRVLWLVSGWQAQYQQLEVGQAPPPDLKPVLDELGKIGIEDVRMLAHTIVNTSDDNKPFTMSGLVGSPLAAEFNVSGVLKGQVEAKQWSLDIRVRARALKDIDAAGNAAGTTSGGSGPALCSIDTHVTAPTGHFVVLGAAPTQAMTSVLVVQILEGQGGGFVKPAENAARK